MFSIRLVRVWVVVGLVLSKVWLVVSSSGVVVIV